MTAATRADRDQASPGAVFHTQPMAIAVQTAMETRRAQCSCRPLFVLSRRKEKDRRGPGGGVPRTSHSPTQVTSDAAAATTQANGWAGTGFP